MRRASDEWGPICFVCLSECLFAGGAWLAAGTLRAEVVIGAGLHQWTEWTDVHSTAQRVVMAEELINLIAQSMIHRYQQHYL